MAVDFESVRKLAIALKDVVEGTSYGTPAFRARGVLFVRLRDDINSLVLRTSMEEREELMSTDPNTYFITDHYLAYPWVLVRLDQVHPDAVPGLLKMAWQSAIDSKRRKADSAGY